MEAESLIRDVLARNTGRPCLTCSFQAEDMVVLDILRKGRPDVAVVFLDTGYHFPETYEYRDRMTRAWNLNLVNLQPELTVPEQESRFGILYESAPDRCCRMRKVEPLFGELARYDVWFTGLRREQSPTRAGLPEIETHRLASGKELTKVNPLAMWKWHDVWSYLRVNEIDYLPLYDQGYTSIGCRPCTTPPVDGGDARSGRWGGRKLECGIHVIGEGRRAQ